MDPEPLNHLDLTATSRAEESAFYALAALCAAGEEQSLQYRLIGGQAVQLHAYRWRLGAELYRESADADGGFHLTATSAISLKDALERRGFIQVHGDRFEKILPCVDQIPRSELTASIDILSPAWTSRVRSNRQMGPLTTQESAGLAAALKTPEVRIELNLRGETIELLGVSVKLPTEACTLALKTFALRDRSADRDAFDVWRCLEIASAANVHPSDFAAGELAEAAAVLRLLTVGSGLRQEMFRDALVRQGGLSPQGVRRRWLRMQALAAAVVGVEQPHS
jgi:hypothetical protein